VLGVCKTKNGKYQAQIWRNSKNIHLGTFDTLEEAAKVATKARKEYKGT